MILLNKIDKIKRRRIFIISAIFMVIAYIIYLYEVDISFDIDTARDNLKSYLSLNANYDATQDFTKGLKRFYILEGTTSKEKLLHVSHKTSKTHGLMLEYKYYYNDSIFLKFLSMTPKEITRTYVNAYNSKQVALNNGSSTPCDQRGSTGVCPLSGRLLSSKRPKIL